MNSSQQTTRRIRRRSKGTAIYVRLTLALCIQSFVSAQAQESRDSSGVHIVHFGSKTKRASWTIDKVPALEIGASPGEINTEFSMVVGVAILQSGQIAVANGGTSELRYFDSRGRFVRSVGRAGQGPGELDMAMVGLRRAADTLVVTDAALRAQVFAPDGRLIRSLQRPSLGTSEPATDRLGFTTDGRTVWMEMQPVVSASPGRVQQYFTMIFVPPTPGDRVREVRRFPGFEVQFGGPRGSQPVWYGPTLLAAVSTDWICVGYSKSYEIDCFDHNGKQTSRIEREFVPRRVRDSDREFVTNRVRAKIQRAPPAMRAGVEASIKSYVYADRLPTFGGFLAATTGELWVRDFGNSDVLRDATENEGRALTWSVFATRGEWIADISLPARFAPFDAGRDYVAGVSFGDDDVERVTVLRLRR